VGGAVVAGRSAASSLLLASGGVHGVYVAVDIADADGAADTAGLEFMVLPVSWTIGVAVGAVQGVQRAAAAEIDGPCERPRPSVYRTPLDVSHLRRDFRLCAKAGIEACRHRGICGALRLGHVESGVDVAEITWLTSHFSCRTTETIYRRELRTLIAADTGAMDRICIQPGTPVRGV
jgi:hypothetical protein